MPGGVTIPYVCLTSYMTAPSTTQITQLQLTQPKFSGKLAWPEGWPASYDKGASFFLTNAAPQPITTNTVIELGLNEVVPVGRNPHIEDATHQALLINTQGQVRDFGAFDAGNKLIFTINWHRNLPTPIQVSHPDGISYKEDRASAEIELEPGMCIGFPIDSTPSGYVTFHVSRNPDNTQWQLKRLTDTPAP